MSSGSINLWNWYTVQFTPIKFFIRLPIDENYVLIVENYVVPSKEPYNIRVSIYSYCSKGLIYSPSLVTDKNYFYSGSSETLSRFVIILRITLLFVHHLSCCSCGYCDGVLYTSWNYPAAENFSVEDFASVTDPYYLHPFRRPYVDSWTAPPLRSSLTDKPIKFSSSYLYRVNSTSVICGAA